MKLLKIGTQARRTIYTYFEFHCASNRFTRRWICFQKVVVYSECSNARITLTRCGLLS
jgi:hypothetical protein